MTTPRTTNTASARTNAFTSEPPCDLLRVYRRGRVSLAEPYSWATRSAASRAPSRRTAPATDFARAARAGKPDPGPIHVRQAAEDAAEARRRVDGETAAVASITADIRALHDAKATVWEADVVARLADAAKGEANLMPPILEAVRAYATLGEICGALRRVWGEYVPPTAV